MAETSQAQNNDAAEQLELIDVKHYATLEERRFVRYREIMELIEQGVSKAEIARRLEMSPKTIYNTIHDFRGKDVKFIHQQALDESARRVARKLSRITEIALDEIIRLKDRDAALSILRDTGVLDSIRPVGAKREDDGRITFEFNFAPPPWAPKAVQIAKVVSGGTNENKPQLPAIAASVDVPPRD